MKIPNSKFLQKPALIPPLDPDFRPAVLFTRAFQRTVTNAGGGVPLILGLERSDGAISRFETQVLPGDHPDADNNLFYCERILKFFLWQRGGWKIFIGGPKKIGDSIKRIYSPQGQRAFDSHFMGEDVYLREFTVIPCEPNEVPPTRESERSIGRHFDGCRVGFDLGASDLKVAALIDGEPIFSKEIEWNPKDQTNPNYHKANIMVALEIALEKLPRLDAIGGSSAGVYIANRPMVASLFRSIPRERFGKIRDMFLEIQSELDVPLVVVNDGEVTALAGSMSLGENGVLGIAMGSSEAAGYVTMAGNITSWLNELAFTPIDYSPDAPIDEWSGDRGCGANYLSQQCVFRLAPKAGIIIPPDLSNAGKLKFAQEKLEADHEGAHKIWQSLGYYTGYAIAHYADFYDLKHILILGRVTSGKGGNIILEGAQEVLRKEFPELEPKIKIHLPDELSRRVGQSIAAASLPEIKLQEKSMLLRKEAAQIYIPDGSPVKEALARTTHLAIGAHQDDLEIMAIDGILQCYQQQDKWFTGVVVTNGAGSPRAGLYANYTDGEMRSVRITEQKKAAVVGEYSAQLLLDYSSKEVKDSSNDDVLSDLRSILQSANPEIVYTHNLADKHPTHVAISLRTIEAIRSLHGDDRPDHLYGCEVWRDLGWMLDEDKVVFDCTGHENLQMALLGIFDSQISGGKRYDLATMGRRSAHATYYASHDVDFSTGMSFGMDLTPLIKDPNLDIQEYVRSFIDRFEGDVRDMIDAFL